MDNKQDEYSIYQKKPSTQQSNIDMQARLTITGFHQKPMVSITRPNDKYEDCQPFKANLHNFKVRKHNLEPKKVQVQSVVLKAVEKKASLNNQREDEKKEKNNEGAFLSSKQRGEPSDTGFQTNKLGKTQSQFLKTSKVKQQQLNQTQSQFGIGKMNATVTNQRNQPQLEFDEKKYNLTVEGFDFKEQMYKTANMFNIPRKHQREEKLPPIEVMAKTQNLNFNEQVQSNMMNQTDIKFKKQMIDLRCGVPFIDQRWNNIDEENEQDKSEGEEDDDLQSVKDIMSNSKRPQSKLDSYIQLILKNVANVDQFIYLVSLNEEDPYDLDVVEYPLIQKAMGHTKNNQIQKKKQDETDINKDSDVLKKKEKTEQDIIAEKLEALQPRLKEYYTISKRGLSKHVNDKPVEFIALVKWVQERETYDSIKRLKFFTKFRKWKTLKMWRKNVIKIKTQTTCQELEDKLFYLNPILRNTLLNFRKLTYEMQEKQRFIGIERDNLSGESTYTLEKFKEIQEKKRKKVNEQIQECSKKCRVIVKEGFEECLNSLKRKQQANSQNEEEMQNTRKQNQNFFRLKESAYENLGFSDNMTYEMRSDLRKECTKFLRFSYLVDFIALQSLDNIFVSSVNELQDKLIELLVCENKFIQREQSTKAALMNNADEPLFQVNLIDNFEEIDYQNKSTEDLREFCMPPIGSSREEDFNYLYHVKLKEKKPKENAAAEEEESVEDDDDAPIINEDKLYQRVIIPKLTDFWLRISPDKHTFGKELVKCIAEGGQSIQAFERWSKHDDMTHYVSVLEEWDDMVGEDWEHPECLFLQPQQQGEGKDANELGYNKSFQGIIDKAFEACENCIKKEYQRFLMQYYEQQQLEQSLYIYQDEKLDNPGEAFEYTLKQLSNQSEDFKRMLPSHCDLGLIRIDCVQLRDKLKPYPEQLIEEFKKFLPPMIKKRNEIIQDWMKNSIDQIKSTSKGIDEFVNQQNALQQIQKYFPKYKNRFQVISNIRDIVKEQQKFDFHKDINGAITTTQNKQKNLEAVIVQAEDSADRNRDRYIKEVQYQHIKNLNSTVQRLEAKVSLKKYICNDDFSLEQEGLEKAAAELFAMDKEMNDAINQSKQINHYEKSLGIQKTIFEEIYITQEELKLRLSMWDGLQTWNKLQQGWIDGAFNEIKTEDIKQKAEQYSKIISKCEKRLPKNPILDQLKIQVYKFKDTMPIVIALSNKHLQRYHKEDINKVLKKNIFSEQVTEDKETYFGLPNEFKLRDLTEMRADEYKDEIIEISTQAKSEAILQDQYNELKDAWKEEELALFPYTREGSRNSKEANIITDVDELYEKLDGYLAQLNNILGSRYLKVLRDKVQQLWKEVMTTQEVLDEILAVQKQWIYLENIFSSESIRQKLRQEASEFDKIDGKFRSHLKAHGKKKISKNQIFQQSMKKEWQTHKDKLNDIGKELEKMLDEKRSVFPRFYFLSNDELLEIMAKQGDFENTQKNMKKCFDGIHRLHCNDRQVHGLISPEGEIMELYSAPRAYGGANSDIEKWLQTLEEKMRETVKKNITKAKNDFESSDIERKEWVVKHAAQVVATVANLEWTYLTQQYIENMQDDPDALSTHKETQESQLSDLTDLIMSGLSFKVHRSIVALITQDVHARDIVESLDQEEVSSINDFLWLKQLRYYEDTEESRHVVIIKQINAQIDYGYEYLGATTRLVITPLTDRCWITITGALNIKLGASPAGPAGTGKTESTKDLAKGLGMVCIVFNCSDQIDYQMMGRHFSGLAEQGCWTCLDEFNRIDIEVLSVIAQQLSDIRQYLLQGLKEIPFSGANKPIQLKEGYGVFITMNPGYAGRTELPDNLKVLFRSVSMMIPDYRLIAEIMLFAEGFSQAKGLSNKMAQLYKLSSEQLSQQDHYDFGMRAVKSVLVMAGTIKRSQRDLKESQVLIKAMRDSNIPKFLKQDLPLFNALIKDLFPDTEVTETTYEELEPQIQQSFSELSFIYRKELSDKVIQLFETFNVRFGVMLVGWTCSGKSTIYKILQHSMTQLFNKSSPDKRMQEVITHILNPKCISMGELYGRINPSTQEWKDGLASHIMRDCSSDETERNQWVVFDGPVDALWIENMNTVLDDNMMLCLSNGQRIKLRNQMRMLFEVQDLRVASPATVSRCGMVYMMQEDLDWKCYVDAWIENKFSEYIDKDGKNCEFFNEEIKRFLLEQFEKTIDDGFEKIREFTEVIPTSNLQLVISLCNMIECFVDEKFGWKQAEKTEYKRRFLSNVFAFCYIWTVGVTVKEEFIDKVSNAIRDMFQNILFPNIGNVQDYYLRIEQNTNEIQYSSWNDKVPHFEYNKDEQFFNILVPTVDTFRYSYFIHKLLKQQKNVYLVGDAGTGKSVIISNMLQELAVKDNIDSINIIFSAQTSSKDTQATIENKSFKIKKGTYGARPNRMTTIFIDDVNMPATEQYGAQAPIELLRLLLDKKYIYERKEDFLKWNFENTSILCCSAPSGGGRAYLTPRFTRHFNILVLLQPSKVNLEKIFQSMLSGFFKENSFPDNVKMLSIGMVNSTIEIYQRIQKEKLPIPSKFHYTFNLRDVSKVFQGIMMTNTQAVRDDISGQRLWIHEVTRVFHDRLNTEEDKEWFYVLVIEVLQRSLKAKFNKDDIFGQNSIMYGDQLSIGDDKDYREIKDKKKLLKVLDDKMDDYNAESSHKLNLVFFDQAVQHILRISRIFNQPRGNGMLIGVGGSGKQSLTHLATYLNGYKMTQLEIMKGFNLEKFRDQIKILFETCGIQGKASTFLFTDTQIIDEAFLEDINNILNSGEIPNLYDHEEKANIISEGTAYNTSLKRPTEPDTIYKTFVERVRNNLHILLCMSPIGSALRVRCRQFPSLVNCCTLDLFSSWPEEALLSVSKRLLSETPKFPDSKTYAETQELFFEKLANSCSLVHLSAKKQAENFENALKRKVFNTPKSFLDLIKLYTQTLISKRNEIEGYQNRLASGLTKLEKANLQVADLRVRLTELKPELEASTIEVNQKLEQAQVEKEIADQKEVVVDEEAQEVLTKENKVNDLKKEAQKELDLAQPEVDKAIAAVNAIDIKELQQIRGYANPHQSIQNVMFCICILFNKKQDWDQVKKLLQDLNKFVKDLRDYDKDNMPEQMIKKLTNAMKLNDLEKLKVSNPSALNMAQFCDAMLMYNKVYKIVEPKVKLVNQLEEELRIVQAELKQKLDALKEIQDKVQKLNDECQFQMQKKQDLEQEMERTITRLKNSELLINLTEEESIRWKVTVETLNEKIENLFGDVFLSCAVISYNGPFTGLYRNELVSQWEEKVRSEAIPGSEEFSLIKTLADPIQLRNWGLKGLPNDQVSQNNSIIITQSYRWPLIIDPQKQASMWIKNMEKDNQLRVTKQTHDKFLTQLEGAIPNGYPVLIEEVDQQLDPAIDNILSKEVHEFDGRSLIKIGKKEFDYNNEFRLYLITKIPNPDYLPEIFIKVNVVNFTATFEGLEDQFLNFVVKNEKPEIQEQRDENIISLAENKNRIMTLEKNILNELAAASAETILDNTELIQCLQDSKAISIEVLQRIEESTILEQKIEKTRSSYRDVSIRGSILFFVIKDLALIDPMYQYSLQYITKLFNKAMAAADESDVQEIRLHNIIQKVTSSLYVNVCRGLFEQHKRIFSFLMATSINRNASRLKSSEWNFFLRGTQEIEKTFVNPDKSLITQTGWNLICNLEREYNEFKGIHDSLTKNLQAWKDYLKELTICEGQDIFKQQLPEEWGSKLNYMQQMLLIKALKQEKTIFTMSCYVNEYLGPFYLESPITTVQMLHQESDIETPIIFVLSTGADPKQALYEFVKERQMSSNFKEISLGQGQGEKARVLIEEAKREGNWVLLQNCHLAKTWMVDLEDIVSKFSEDQENTEQQFRLFLTSMPANYFPVSVLQNGIKLTTEPPRGLKANLKRMWNQITTETLNKCDSDEQLNISYHRLTWGLTYFHAIIQERRKFGPLGWNIRYEFDDSDFETSITMLYMLLNEQKDDIPWEALKFVTGDINYGGRVTDDWDRRCLRTILRKFYTEQALTEKYSFSEAKVYVIPEIGDQQSYLQFIESLPLEDNPAVFGMHENANSVYQQQESVKQVDTILNIQPRLSVKVEGQLSNDEIVSNISQKIIDELPELLSKEDGFKDLFIKDEMGLIPSLSTVLEQEYEKFARLLKVIFVSMTNLIQAIDGLMVMSEDLDNTYFSLINNQVPELWRNVGYPSLKPLASWLLDLKERVTFISQWLKNGNPFCYWISGFFFPQGFLTGVLQTHARKYAIAIDQLTFKFRIQDVDKETCVMMPTDGVYIYGLFLEGATWDRKKKSMVDSAQVIYIYIQNQLYCPMPIIHFIPTEQKLKEKEIIEEVYSCPVYKTSIRAGTLSTTGQSTNYILAVDIPSKDQYSEFWIIRGSALLCMLNE